MTPEDCRPVLRRNRLEHASADFDDLLKRADRGGNIPQPTPKRRNFLLYFAPGKHARLSHAMIASYHRVRHMPMETHASKPQNAVRNRDRIRALRRHAIAIGALIDELQPQDLSAWRPGDVAQIPPGEPNAGALIRVTRVEEKTVRGYLLAAKFPGRDSLPWPRYPIKDLVRIGHAPDAVAESEYPLREKVTPSAREYAEAVRQEWIRNEAAKKSKRAERDRARRAAKKANAKTQPEQHRTSAA